LSRLSTDTLSFPYFLLLPLFLFLFCWSLAFVVLCSCYLNCSTKDPGQQPFKFKIGLGQVIKGNTTKRMFDLTCFKAKTWFWDF
jgi:hypothetical protein